MAGRTVENEAYELWQQSKTMPLLKLMLLVYEPSFWLMYLPRFMWLSRVYGRELGLREHLVCVMWYRWIYPTMIIQSHDVRWTKLVERLELHKDKYKFWRTSGDSIMKHWESANCINWK